IHYGRRLLRIDRNDSLSCEKKSRIGPSNSMLPVGMQRLTMDFPDTEVGAKGASDLGLEGASPSAKIHTRRKPVAGIEGDGIRPGRKLRPAKDANNVRPRPRQVHDLARVAPKTDRRIFK